MKKYKLFAMGMAMAGALTFSSCEEDYLETRPTDAVSEDAMKESVESLFLGLNGIHRQMISQTSGYQCMGGLGGMMYIMDIEADDITWQTNTWMKAAYLGWQCNTNGQNGYNTVFWRLYYQWIMNANTLLKAIDGMDVNSIADADMPQFKQTKGELLVLRAFTYFQLVQTYADRYVAGSTNSQLGVPLRLIDTMEGELARSTVEEVYAQINKDLDEGIELLTDNGFKFPNADLNHYTPKVAYGIKARVAMAMQNYAKAAEYAAKSIELAEADGHVLMQATYDRDGNIDKNGELFCGFSKITQDAKEAMYAAMTLGDQTIYYYSYYAYMSWNFSSTANRQGVKAINADTYDTMSETDFRREWWDPTGEAEVPTTSFKKIPYQNRKYTAQASNDAVGDVAFMRLAEMYLTLAEAYARNGEDAKAQEVFTKFQVTRDPAYTSKGNTGEALAEEIMNSRRVELWGEGLRYFDLKRLHLPIKRGRNFDITFCTFLEKDADAEGWTWEIPKHETDNNPLCEKNY